MARVRWSPRERLGNDRRLPAFGKWQATVTLLHGELLPQAAGRSEFERREVWSSYEVSRGGGYQGKMKVC